MFKALRNIVRRPHNQPSTKIPGRLGVLFGAALLLSLLLAGNGATASQLFQSPASPPPAVENAPPGFEPSNQPEGQPAESQPAPQQPAQPAQPQQPATTEEQSPQPDTGSEGTAVEQDPTLQTTQTESQPANNESVEPVPLQLDDNPPPSDANGERNFVLDQAELIDTVVVSTAYVWLCCGIILFLLIPISFLFLYIRGRTKIVREEAL